MIYNVSSKTNTDYRVSIKSKCSFTSILTCYFKINFCDTCFFLIIIFRESIHRWSYINVTFLEIQKDQNEYFILIKKLFLQPN
jgi:hypothetical protein